MLSSNLVLLVIVFLICTAISYYFKIIAQVLDHIENQSSFTFGNRHFWYFIVLFFNIFGVLFYYATQRKRHLK